MFTGIVMGRGEVVGVRDADGLRHLRVRLPAGRAGGLQTGASVAVSGVCLTVVAFDDHDVDFDVIDETLRRTTLGALRVGDAVNIERAARFGDEIGGHLLSGHVAGTAELVGRRADGANLQLDLRLPPALRPYVLSKGYLGVDGCSLTVGAADGGQISLHLIPETLRLTTLGDKALGDALNIEVDAMTQAVVDTVERVLAARGAG